MESPLRLLCVALLLFQAGHAQQKKPITGADYRLWSQMANEAISPDGNWISYTLQYATGEDTLTVAGSAGRFDIPAGREGTFTETGRYVCRSGKDLIIIGLSSAEKRKIGNVRRHETAGRWLAWLHTDGRLTVMDADGKEVVALDSVADFKLSPSGHQAAFSRKGAMGILSLDNKGIQTLFRETAPLQRAFWKEDGSQVAFTTYQAGIVSLYWYDLKTKTARQLNPKSLTIEGAVFAIERHTKPYFTDAGHVIFDVSGKYEEAPAPNVQVWNAADKWLYPAERSFDGGRKYPKLFIWKVGGEVMPLHDNTLPEATLFPGGRHAILYHPQDYSPHFRWAERRDLYVVDTESGQKTLLAKEEDKRENPFVVSPDGKYLARFDGRQWVLHALATGKSRPLAGPADISYPSRWEKVPYPHDFAGWTSDGRGVLLHDTFDLWYISLDGKERKRLTAGRERGIVYRLLPPTILQAGGPRRMTGHRYDLGKELLLEARTEDYQYSGFYALKDGKISEIVWRKAKTSSLKSNGHGSYSWMEQTYERPPVIMLRKTKGTAAVMARSNVHHDRFEWGSAKQISYAGPAGEKLYGSLYLPPNYDASRSYPMIVNVYERKSHAFHDYLIPYHQNGDGFNVSNLLAHDYIILLPDITYTIGDPGPSAVFCMNGAIDEAIHHANIDTKRIGLIGHSFGGFEAAFASTHTSRFAAIVAGAAYADMISGYLTMSENYEIPEMFRHEHYQLRMGGPLFDDLQGYLRNSPVIQAPKIKTPVLTWVGTKDRQVPPHHSYEYYFALRRLGKEHIMLVYPDEDHAIGSLENNLDLNKKIEDWFGHYLKGEPVPEWMAPK